MQWSSLRARSGEIELRLHIMPALVDGIQVLLAPSCPPLKAGRVGTGNTWMGGTSPAMTLGKCLTLLEGALGCGEFAGRREERFLLLDRLQNPMLAAPDFEDELAHERLVV